MSLQLKIDRQVAALAGFGLSGSSRVECSLRLDVVSAQV